jgi:hypothetical protein
MTQGFAAIGGAADAVRYATGDPESPVARTGTGTTNECASRNH